MTISIVLPSLLRGIGITVYESAARAGARERNDGTGVKR
jgi:hypothetical protein